MTILSRRPRHSRTNLRICLAIAILLCANAFAEKPERWLEARTPHFVVVVKGNESTARQMARSAEQIRAAFHAAFPQLRVDPPMPITVLGVRGEKNYQELTPALSEHKGGVHPAGMFSSGPDRSFIAIRLDAAGTEPAHNIAHEYAHVFLRLNSSARPLWLDEGFAEIFANLKTGGKEAQLGLTNENHLRLLRSEHLLPFDNFLVADASSPFYTDPKLAPLYYAQCWLLTHCLVLAEAEGGTSRLNVLLGLLAEGLDPHEAQQRILGDTAKAQKNLEAYLNNPSLKVVRVKIPSDSADREIAVRELSPAESKAVRGTFLAYQDRPSEARGLLDAALKEDPKSAVATEAMGVLAIRGHQDDEGAKWFSQAIALGSASFLPYYYHAALTMRGKLDAASSAQVERELRRSLELNPDYASACEALAAFYRGRNEKLDDALKLAQHAVDLEPRVGSHKLVLAGILLGLHRNLEAKLVAQSLLDTASSEDDRDAAKAMLAAVRSTEKRPDVELGADGKVSTTNQPPSAAPGGGTARASGKTAAGSSRARPTGGKSTKPRGLSAEGKILNVTCSAPAVMDLMLVTTKGTLPLHAENYFKVDFLTLRWKPPDQFSPCQHIQGHTARVVYKPVQDRAYRGEFSSVEMLK